MEPVPTTVKLPLLFSTQRSGSNLVYHFLAEHLEREENVFGLGEFFDLNYQSYWDDGHGIKASVFPSLRAREAQPPAGLRSAIWRQRVDLLQRYPRKYFFKIQSNAMPLEHLGWLTDTYDWVLLERRNLLNQMLSYLISMETGRWYEADGLKIERGSIRAREDHICLFKRMIYDYHAVKAQLKNPTVLIYEELIARENIGEEIVARCGLTRTRPEPLMRLSPQQNPENKLPLFSNPKLIFEAYQASGLNFFSPLEDCLQGIPVRERARPDSSSRSPR